jgi:hypothetical protein
MSQKKGTSVLAILTMHHDKALNAETGDKLKPEVITFYNRTKCGVDLLDQLCASYDVSRNLRHWPLTVFFDLLNKTGINALTVYKVNKNHDKIIRNHFIRTLGLDEMKPQIS